MARKELDPKESAGLFKKTEPEQPQDADQPKDEVKSYGVGLRESEWKQYEAIAAELGQTKHKVAAYALRDFLRRWEAGEIQTETKPSLPGMD
jgi:hypothetical protein